jgi:EmrB/QacA subfamily drug resistance transporter
VQWTIDAYSLSLAAFLLPAGSLADIFGRRRMFALGLVIFTVGSLLCGLARTGTELILWRALQGVGGATVFATSLALLAQNFQGKERGMAFGAWGAVAGVSTAIGPLLGGVFTTELSWHWTLYVNLPIGALAVYLTLTRVAEFRPEQHRRLDLVGFALFTLGLTALVFGLIESGFRGWGSTEVVLSLTIAVLSLVLFAVAETRIREPMFKLGLFRKPAFLGGSLAAFAMNASLYSLFLYIVLYFQNADGFSALGCGLRLAIITAGALITAIPAGRLSSRVPVRYLIGPGLLLVGIGLLLMRGLGGASSWTHLIPGFLVAGIGSGLVNAPLASTAVGVVEPHETGMASGINTTCRQIGVATSVAALGSVFASQLGHVTARTLDLHYASALNELFLITACVAGVGGVLALALIRPQDFHAHARA